MSGSGVSGSHAAFRPPSSQEGAGSNPAFRTTDLPDALRAKIRDTGHCWAWTASLTTRGYGQVWDAEARAPRPAHRVVYELLRGAIPGGLQLDHVCRNRACVNPAHLEAVTGRLNTQRGALSRPVCQRGHPKDGLGRCKTCHQEYTRDWKRANRSATGPRTACPRGHVFDAANTYVAPDGERQCRECARRRKRDRRARGLR